MKKYKFKINGNPYHVNILESTGNSIQLELNGTAYEVMLETEVKTTKTPTLVRTEPRLTQKVDALKTSTTKKVTAPLPGIVLKLLVKEGDAVKIGDELLVLEAMKMENTILAESSGAIRSIKVQPNGAVLQGDLLMEII